MKGHYNYPLPKDNGTDIAVITLNTWNTWIRTGAVLREDGVGFQASELGYDRTLDAFDKKAEDCDRIVWFNK